MTRQRQYYLCLEDVDVRHLVGIQHWRRKHLNFVFIHPACLPP